MVLSSPLRALFFDVFGTCVDWRTTVVDELQAQAHVALNSATASLASRVRLTASEMTSQHWSEFAQQWRDGYKMFTRSLAIDPSVPWKSVDEHHLESLKELVVQWQINGLWDDEQLRAISLVWHRLGPWSDAAMGVALLNKAFDTCTLSNGNLSLLADLCTHSGIRFTHTFSAELFGTYKPSPRVYLGAAERLQLQPEQCAMVAAHLNDLRAAKDNGLKVIYVERPGEEEWSLDQVEKARQDGWVDLWIDFGNGSNGFITVASKLGIELDASDQSTLGTSAPVGCS